MCVLLKEEGVWAPLFDQTLKVDKSVLELQDEKAHSLNKEYGHLLLLSDKVLYKVSQKNTNYELWLKLEKLSMKKSICNKLILKQRLFGL